MYLYAAHQRFIMYIICQSSMLSVYVSVYHCLSTIIYHPSICLHYLSIIYLTSVSGQSYCPASLIN